MQQGPLKKIEVHLLLADLALQLGNALARRFKLRGRSPYRRRRICARNRAGSFGLARPAPAPQSIRAAGLETIPPSV